MEIKSTLYKPFEAELDRLKEKYGEEMLVLCGISDEQLDESKMMDKLIDSKTTADASIDPTSNIGAKDIDIIMHEVKKPQFKLKSLNRLFKDMVNLYGLNTANEWLEKEITGALYLHDGFEASFKPYCYNYTCETVAKKGMFFDPSLKADISQHLHSFHEHILEFVRFCAKRQSGSVGIGDFLIWSNYYYHKDKKSNFLGITEWDRYKEQNFQNFVYSLNQSGARSGQSAFTNVSIFDREYVYALFGDKFYPDGSPIIDYVEDIIQYQKDFLDFLKKERAKKLLTFPVLGASLLFKDGEFVDKDMARFCSDHIYLWKDLPIMCEDDVTSVSSCCRLKSSLKTLGLFSSIVGASLEIGSVKVSTVNLNRIGLDTNFNSEQFFEELKYTSILNLKILNAQRKRIEKNIEKGMMTLYDLGLMKLKNQYSTYGITAFGDVMEGFGFLKTDEFGNQYYTEEGYLFGEKIFNIVDECISTMNFDYMVNKEAVPFESGAISCVKKDRLIYGNKVVNDLYSNQWLSLGKKSTLQEKVKSASKFDKNCSGGSMLFVNIEGEFADKEQTWNLLNSIAKQGVVTINIVTKLNICEKEHNYREKTDVCPICGSKKIDEATKIVGFYTRKSNWQKERREEDRKWFNYGEL